MTVLMAGSIGGSFGAVSGDAPEGFQWQADHHSERVDVALAPVTSVEPAGTLAFALGAPSPNPSMGRFQVRYVLPRRGHVRLSLLDLQGRVVSILVDRPQEAGTHGAAWEARGTRTAALASGIYVLRLETAGASLTRQVVLVR